MNLSHLVVFCFSLGIDKVLLLVSFLFLVSLFFCPLIVYVVIVAFICVFHDLGCVVATYWLPIGRRSSDASRRPSRSPPHASHVPFNCYDDFYDLFHHPTIALAHIPCTYLPLLSLSFIVCCFVIPFPFTALFRACTPGSQK